MSEQNEMLDFVKAMSDAGRLRIIGLLAQLAWPQDGAVSLGELARKERERKAAAKPARVMLEPAGTLLTFEHRDGEVHLTVPRVDIHEVIVVSSGE